MTITAPNATAPPVGGRAGGGKKRDSIIDEAALVLNVQGVGNTKLSDIADRLGLTRAALYYYFADMETLAAACYERTIATMLDGLAAAEGQDAAIGRLRRYVATMASPAVMARIALIEPEALQGASAGTLTGALNGAVEGLIELVREGVRDRSLRPVTPGVAAAAMLGAMAELALLFQQGRREDAERRAGQLTRLFEGGISRDRCRIPATFGASLALAAEAEIGFDRGALVKHKRDVILRTATDMFNRSGVDSVTLDDIVERLGVTKGVFYHYFKSKEHLLVACYARGFDLAERIARHVDATGLDPLARVAEFVALVTRYHNSAEGPFVIFYGTHALSDGNRNATIRRVQTSERLLQGWLRDAKAAGQLSFEDVDFVQHAIDGIIRWLPKWQMPEGNANFARLGDKLAQLLLHGYAAG